MARALVSAPPRHMLWLRQCDTPTQESFIKCMTDAGIGADMELESLEDVKRDHLLALRGLLAYGILEHCLMKRHRVDYGVDRFKGRKRLAIPFRACETPVPRAEFGHPDVALVSPFYHQQQNCPRNMSRKQSVYADLHHLHMFCMRVESYHTHTTAHEGS